MIEDKASIVRPVTTAELSPKKRSLSRDIDITVLGISSLTAVGVFLLSCYFFYGFTETDRGVWTLLNSAVLCFGLGALAYGPMIVTAITAKRSLRGKVLRIEFVLIAALMLPWIIVAGIFLAGTALPLTYSLLMLSLSSACFLWALAGIRRNARAPLNQL